MWGLVLKLLSSLTPLLFTFGNVIVGFVAVPIFKSIQKHWVPWLIGVLLITNLTTGLLLYRSHEDLSTQKHKYEETVKSYKTAKEEAEDKVAEVTERLEKKAKIDAKQSDQTYAALLKRYNASLVRYKAAESLRSGASGGNASGAAAGGNGAGGNSELPAQLTISGDDARICAVNTAKLQSLQAWALTLQGAK